MTIKFIDKLKEMKINLLFLNIYTHNTENENIKKSFYSVDIEMKNWQNNNVCSACSVVNKIEDEVEKEFSFTFY